MPLSTEVGLGPGYIMLDGDPAPPPKKGAQPPIFGRCLLWPNGWIDQDATWYESRRQPRRHCVNWGPSSPQKTDRSPIFGPCLLWPNGWTDQGATWYGGRHRPRPHCVTWGPSSPPPKKGGTAPSNFRPMSIVAKRSPIWATALFFNFVSFTSPLARPCCLVLLRLLLRVLMCSVSGRMSRPSDKRRRRRPLLGGPQRGGGHVSKTAARRR